MSTIKYPNDFLKRSLLEGCPGGQITLPLPEGMTVDERVSLRNACMVPGIKAVFFLARVDLSICEIGEESVIDEFI